MQMIRKNGDVVRFNPETNHFGILTKDGAIRTYYIPDPKRNKMSNVQYFIQEGSK